MGLLDTWSRRATERREGKVEFLAEQNGLVESTLKRALIMEFATRPAIRRAYIASVHPAAEGETRPATAICIVSANPDDRSLVVRVGDIIRRHTTDDAAFDVFFLTPEEERDVERVARAFYVSPT